MSAEAVDIPRLGIRVTPMTASDTVAWLSAVEGKRLLLNHNLHSAYLYQKDPAFRDFYERAERVVIDGAPILWFARRKAPQGLAAQYRIGSTDWIERLAEADAPGRLFIYGAAEESNRRAVSNLRKELVPRGWHVEGKDGYADRDEAIEWLRAGEPTLVMVGLGMPLQEEFLQAAWDELPDAVYATVGGAIDYAAGNTLLAPRWMGRFGIEWLWRLVHDPRRLAHRYLVEPFKLAWSLVTKERHRSERKRDQMPGEESTPIKRTRAADSRKG